jgi:hypothetical protein
VVCNQCNSWSIVKYSKNLDVVCSLALFSSTQNWRSSHVPAFNQKPPDEYYKFELLKKEGKRTGREKVRKRRKTKGEDNKKFSNIRTGGLLSNGYPVVKRRRRQADHSPHPVPRLRMRGAIPPLSRKSSSRGAWLITGYIFVVWYLFKQMKHTQL